MSAANSAAIPVNSISPHWRTGESTNAVTTTAFGGQKVTIPSGMIVNRIAACASA